MPRHFHWWHSSLTKELLLYLPRLWSVVLLWAAWNWYLTWFSSFSGQPVAMIHWRAGQCTRKVIHLYHKKDLDRKVFCSRLAQSLFLSGFRRWQLGTYCQRCEWLSHSYSPWQKTRLWYTRDLSLLVELLFLADPKKHFPGHNLPLTVLGTGLLWVGWTGYIGGSALAANGMWLSLCPLNMTNDMF
jgi:Ammonium Transporter Family